MKAKLTQNQTDISQGYDYLYNLELGSGEWEVLTERTRSHNTQPIICDFKLLRKNGEYILLGSSANASSWVGRKIDCTDWDDWALENLDKAEEYLDSVR